jgi:type III pantothenate kinase
MILLLDLGNTRLKWATLAAGVLEPGPPLPLAALAEFAPPPGVRTAWLASVADATSTAALERRLDAAGVPLQRFGPPQDSPRLALAYRRPAELGVDRWLAMLAAADAATLVVSCGSALTIELVDGHRHHRGGLIAPSPERMRAALLAQLPQLQRTGGEVHDFAAGTADAVASGAVLAAVALIERQARRAAALLDARPRLLLTGGGRGALRPHLAPGFEEREWLVFEGMRALLD